MIKQAHLQSKFMQENYVYPEQRKSLAKLAGHLDKIGRHTEADYVDAILKRAFDMENMLSSLVPALGGAFIDNVQGKILEYVTESLGIETDGFGFNMLKNFVENFDVDEITAMATMTAGERCEKISLELTNALQKTLLERKITNKLESVLEGAVNSIFGFIPGGKAADAVEAVIDEAFIRSANELITTYLTENNIISQYISRMLCDAFEALIGYLASTFPALRDMLGISEAEANQMTEALDFSSLTGGLRSLQEGGRNLAQNLQQGGQNLAQNLQQGAQNLQNQGQRFVNQQIANNVLGPTLGPQAINLGQRFGLIP